MAAKAISRSSSSPKGESKNGLIVTLVFFILATIGLGVSTYFGFSEQETLRADKDKSESTQKKRSQAYRLLSIPIHALLDLHIHRQWF